MGLYQLVHLVSIILAGISVASLCVLISSQAVVSKRKSLEARRKKHLMAVALEYMEEPETLPAFKAQLKASDKKLLIRVFIELLPKLKGDYASLVVNLMRELGILDRGIKELSSPKWWKRAEACSALGYFDDPTVISALENALDDPIVSVRLEAARSLSKLNAVQSVAGLVARLAMVDPSHSLGVTQIFRSLGSRAVLELVAVLDSDVSDNVKVLAADALGYIGDSRVLPSLLRHFDSSDIGDVQSGGTHFISRGRGFSANPQPIRRSITLQMTLMQALTRLGDEAGARAIERAMDDPVWEMRAQAAQCIGQMSWRHAIPKLERLLHDNHWWVRYHAAEALFRLGVRGRKTLMAAAIGHSPRAAEIASGILREKGVAVS